ncbi:MAG: hypothetical protein IAX21_04085 [Candidatus Bathyarchaeota archaeon]|nr:MAG: hypothetical protein IAX21_04085 [Candidatus Bathyarchaeota archaeon]
MSEVVPLRLRYDKTCALMKRFGKLPKWMQELVREDMETAFENRIKAMERIIHRGI